MHASFSCTCRHALTSSDVVAPRVFGMMTRSILRLLVDGGEPTGPDVDVVTGVVVVDVVAGTATTGLDTVADLAAAGISCGSVVAARL